MKSEKSIFIAFILNLAFSIFEFIGGIWIGSVAIVSDAIHDIGDAASIGIAYFLEKKSQKQPDAHYTYGYAGYSVLGGAITTGILLLGSVAVIYNAVHRILEPSAIHYDSMIVFALIGTVVNLFAAFFTRHGHSLNQRAVNLHMLEDVLGWVVVLMGAIVMKFTDFVWVDPLMSIGVALFIFLYSLRNLKEVINLLLNKTPDGICVAEIKEHLTTITGVTNVHHIHIWSIDGQNHCATMHIVTNDDSVEIKEAVRTELKVHGIYHVTLELETADEHCHHRECHITPVAAGHHHHHVH